MQLFESKSVEERVILVGIQDSREDEVKSLRELEELVDTAGVGKVIQKRESIHPASYVGPGKLEELRELLYTLDATGIVCDDELSPAQYAVLEEELECKVMDRTLVILDIFAGRAATKEGKLQVELAQLKYRAARLVGLRRSLSRLGGGIGTRGPGEKKLEVDRRVIHGRISQLKRELEEVHRHQELLRGRRIKGNQRVAAIVGYTNAGKSTLLNALTGSQVMEEDKLFATLDPTTRMLELPGGQQMLLHQPVDGGDADAVFVPGAEERPVVGEHHFVAFREVRVDGGLAGGAHVDNALLVALADNANPVFIDVGEV